MDDRLFFKKIDIFLQNVIVNLKISYKNVKMKSYKLITNKRGAVYVSDCALRRRNDRT